MLLYKIAQNTIILDTDYITIAIMSQCLLVCGQPFTYYVNACS